MTNLNLSTYLNKPYLHGACFVHGVIAKLQFEVAFPKLKIHNRNPIIG